MLTITLFAAVSGIITISLALLYSIFIGEPKASTMPMVFVMAGVGLTVLGALYVKHKTGRWPVQEPEANPFPMAKPGGTHEDAPGKESKD